MTTDTSAQELWEQRYRAADPTWGTRPNAALVDVLAGLAVAPGRALDLGAGHGGDALWLASRGWTVTAVDVSRTALDRIDAAATEAGAEGSVVTERHDLTETFPDGSFDLVAATYFQSPVTFDRGAVLRRAAAAVAVGGWLVVVEHASAPPWSDHHDASFPTAQETHAAIGPEPARWHTGLCETREREGTGPEGQRATLLDNVLALRRRDEDAGA